MGNAPITNLKHQMLGALLNVTVKNTDLKLGYCHTPKCGCKIGPQSQPQPQPQFKPQGNRKAGRCGFVLAVIVAVAVLHAVESFE